ncbi:MAG: SIS domain-containing protein [Oligosphaeraceae bacterium]
MPSPLEQLLENFPRLSVCLPQIQETARLLEEGFRRGATLFTCGNGGSCADADHIAGEFLKGFCRRRPLKKSLADTLEEVDPEDGAFLGKTLQRGLPCIPLSGFPGALSAVRNDLDGQMDYAQVLLALGRPGDLLLGISTSGNSRNVHLAVTVARSLGMTVLGLTGEGGGRLAREADVAIRVPARETYRVQELHLPVYHALCLSVEEALFPL